MLEAFDRYLGKIKPPTHDRTAMEQYVEVKFARARTYYEAAHFDEAAVAFHDVALHHSDFEAGIFAANLYLESANIMLEKWGKDGCVADMSRAVPKLVKLFCAKGDSADRGEQCAVLAPVLSQSYPSEFHVIDEFRGAPTRVSSGLDERPRPLSMEGKPVAGKPKPQAAPTRR